MKHGIAYSTIRAIWNYLRHSKFYCQIWLRYALQGGKRRDVQVGEAECLLVTHDKGGGTALYEEILLSGMENYRVFRRMGDSVVADTFYEINDQDDHSFLLRPGEETWVFDETYSRLVVSSLVGYSRVSELIAQLVLYRQLHLSTYICYLIHDYHCICPTVNLFVEGAYCNLACDSCSWANNQAHQIEQWRCMWEPLLSKCNEVRCFSESSREILEKAYPTLDNVTVIPHNTSYCDAWRPLRVAHDAPFHLGIIGAVNADFKGRDVVDHIVGSFGHCFPITIAGTHWWKLVGAILDGATVAGRYKQNELREMLETHNITHVLFPSIWPETFSYLTSELMALDVPVIAFGLGAQGEKINSYSKGMIVSSLSELDKLLIKLSRVDEKTKRDSSGRVNERA